MEGFAPFCVPEAGDKPCQTWYMVVGDLSPPRGFRAARRPLIVVHGGPAGCHEYLLCHKELTEDFSIPVIFYDQIGNGNSTRLTEKAGDEDFWTPALFVRELDNLIDHLGLRDRPGGYDVLGQSWGGMVASTWAVTPLPSSSAGGADKDDKDEEKVGSKKGLHRLILYSTCASGDDLNADANRLRASLPADVRAVLDKGEREGDTRSSEFRRAMAVYFNRYAYRGQPSPAPELLTNLEHIEEDPTVYNAIWGTGNEFVATGSLVKWDIRPRLHLIDVPTLVVTGEYDLSSDACTMPLFNRIPKVKWICIDEASHNAHLEKPEKYMGAISQFLLAKD